MSVVVRRCEHAGSRAAADTASLTRLRRTWAEEQAGERLDDTEFEASFAAWHARERPHRITWLAEVDEEPVGMLNLLVYDRMPKPGRPSSQWGYVANVFVLAEHRDGGVGRALVETATTHARAHSFARLVLSPSSRSVPFYRRAGFGRADSLLLLDLAD